MRMHGLVNKAIQSFLRDTFGAAFWDDIAQLSGIAPELGPDGFEAMEIYDQWLTDALLAATTERLARPRETILEDLGTYLISSDKMDPLRRLLRFGGVSFTDFLYSLDDLQGRTALAVPELVLPELRLFEDDTVPGRFQLICHACPPGFGHVLVGVLRALADDYGALAVLEHAGSRPSREPGERRLVHAPDEVITIDLYDPDFHAGRQFALAAVEQPL